MKEKQSAVCCVLSYCTFIFTKLSRLLITYFLYAYFSMFTHLYLLFLRGNSVIISHTKYRQFARFSMI